MQSISIEYPKLWSDYELIDSGYDQKLERFGTYTLIRPDPRAIWAPMQPEDVWRSADATYIRTSPTEGDWQIVRMPPQPWTISYKSLVFTLRPTEFKHVGVFPEQAVNWDWLTSRIDKKPLQILNLFAYTGGATLAAAAAGAHVTHVDSAKGAIQWAKANADASGLSDKPIRWIEDDALKFVLREGRRGKTYDGVILDPPRFGRGSKGEVWKLSESLPKLLTAIKAIMSPKPNFLLLNAYTADLSAIALQNLVMGTFRDKGGNTTVAELAISETKTGRLLPNGLFVRWSETK